MACCNMKPAAIFFLLAYSVSGCKDETAFERVANDVTLSPQRETIFTFPGLVKNPMWMFSSTNLEVSCPDNTELITFFVTENNETACQLRKEGPSRSWTIVTNNSASEFISPFSKSYFGFDIENADSCSAVIRFSKTRRLYIMVFLASLVLFAASPYLSRSAKVHYSTGTVLGVFGSFLVLAYVLSRFVPGRKPIIVGLYLSGWSLTAYLLRVLHNNFSSSFLLPYLLAYVAITSMLSFGVTYYYGPITNTRAQNLVSWFLKIISFIGVYWSLQIEEASFSVILALVTLNFIPKETLNIPGLSYLKTKWFMRYPPKRRLLTAEEFEQEAQTETEKALRELREYCMQEQSNSWKIVKKMKNPSLLASFVEGDSFHVSTLEKSMHDEMLMSRVFSSDEEEQLLEEEEEENAIVYTGSTNTDSSATSRRGTASSQSGDSSFRMDVATDDDEIGAAGRLDESMDISQPRLESSNRNGVMNGVAKFSSNDEISEDSGNTEN